MPKRQFTKHFYLKVIFIISVLGLAYINHRDYIHGVYSDDTISVLEGTSLVTNRILGIPQQPESESTRLTTTSQVTPGNSIPYRPSTENMASDNYQYAAQVAEEFNQQLNMETLNIAFTHHSNVYRRTVGWPELSVGYHLENGTHTRAQQLGEYHYLGSETIDNQDFRSLFPEIVDSDYRLGEHLYELYISAGDIHLQTWQNTDILADYLHDVLGDSLTTQESLNYLSQYIWIHAEPSDYQVEDSPYVRLVVVLTLDTQI